MISKPLITFDGHSRKGGTREARFLCEELLAGTDSLQVTNSVFFRLPFRLRVGSQAIFEVGGKIPGHIMVINSVSSKTIQKELSTHPALPRPEFASDVCVTLSPVTLPEEAKITIKGILNQPDYASASAQLHFLHPHPEDLLKPLNALIVSYRVLCGNEVQGNRVRRVLRKDITGGRTYELHIFKRQNDSIDFHQVEMGLVDARPASSTTFEIGGSLLDIPNKTVKKLQNQLSHDTQYAFYSLALQAEDYIWQTDYLNALLYSVIAFENAHAELIEHVAETKAASPKAREWAQELIRKAGVSSMIRLTPYLFMKPKNRPSDDIIDGVVKAINIRNELAHAKKYKNGSLKIDSHRSDTLLPLVEKVISYINAIARELPD